MIRLDKWCKNGEKMNCNQ